MDPTHVFLMQPYTEDHSERLCETVFAELAEIGCITKRADKDPCHVGSRLQDRVDDYIKKADVCVADLTSPRNENVLLEVGAALTLQIPVVIIASESLPSNIVGNIYVELNPTDLSKEEILRKFRSELRLRMIEAKNRIGHLPTEKFVAHGYPDREGVDFDLLIRRAERRITILTTNLGYVVEQPQVSEAHPKGRTMMESLLEELPKKKSRAFRASILALDPDSNFTNERADSLHRSRRDFREAMRQNLDTLTTALSRIPVASEVRIYNEYPLQMTFFFDDVIVNSVVAGALSSRFCVTYVHNLSYRSARETFERHFDALWGRSRTYFEDRRTN